MTHIQRSALLPYPQSELFALVADVERYPEFLPLLESVALVPQAEPNPDIIEARVELKVAGMRERFVTRNHMQPPDRIELELLEGPFDQFAGYWLFTSLGAAGAEATGCKVELELRFELSRANPIVRRTYSALIERGAGKLVDAFCQRAQAAVSYTHLTLPTNREV